MGLFQISINFLGRPTIIDFSWKSVKIQHMREQCVPGPFVGRAWVRGYPVYSAHVDPGWGQDQPAEPGLTNPDLNWSLHASQYGLNAG